MKDTIIQMIAEQANCTSASLQLDNTLEEDLGLDEVDMTEMLMTLEDEIEQAIDDAQWFDCETVQDIIDLVGSQLATH